MRDQASRAWWSQGQVSTVDVAQSVERRIVIPVVVGSIPIVHPKLDVSRREVVLVLAC
jgi:hypothetical protein